MYDFDGFEDVKRHEIVLSSHLAKLPYLNDSSPSLFLHQITVVFLPGMAKPRPIYLFVEARDVNGKVESVSLTSLNGLESFKRIL